MFPFPVGEKSPGCGHARHPEKTQELYQKGDQEMKKNVPWIRTLFFIIVMGFIIVPAAAADVMREYPKMTMFGNDIGTIGGISKTQCSNECLLNPDCRAAVWGSFANGNICWIKSAASQLVDESANPDIHYAYIKESTEPAVTNTGPTASFTATPSSADPFTVEFDASASSDPDGIGTYAWDFGDNSEDQGVTVSHPYQAAGSYTVTLSVTDTGTPAMTGSTTQQVTVTASGRIPVANFTADKVSGNVPLTVAFDASGSSDPYGTIRQYSWDFGDGKTGSGLMPSHVYESAGTYRVSLTVTDDKGLFASASGTISGSERSKNPPAAGFTASTTSGGPPLRVQFTDTSTGSPSSWTWDFGDGGTASVKNPAHIYTSAGNYSVSLTVTNADGTDTRTMDDFIAVGGGGLPFWPLAGGALVLVLVAAVVFFLWSRSDLRMVLKQKSMPADGTSTIPVRVLFVNAFGQQKKQKTERDVEITTTGGTIRNTVIPEGKAFADTVLTASRESGPVTLTARSAGKEVQGRVDFVFVPGSIAVISNPPEIPADGRSQATVTIRIQDASGSGVTFLEDKVVRLTTNLGTIAPSVTIPARSPEGSATITAGGTGGTATIGAYLDRISGSGTIRFTPPGKRYCMWCGTAKRIDAHYCPECGKMPPSGADTKNCAACVAVIPLAARFCDKCGARQS